MLPRLMRAAAVLALFAAAGAANASSIEAQDAKPSLVQRFQDRNVRTPFTYRARRHLEAANPRFKLSAWLDVMTEFADGRMTFTVLQHGGSELIHNKVLIPALEAEQTLLKEGRASIVFSTDNYRLEEAAPDALTGLQRIRLLPKRADKKLLDGWLFVTPEGDLIEATGKLAKSPSFWTTSVTVTRRYGQLAGRRVPLGVSSTAEVRIAGRSTFSMTYDFEMVDGTVIKRF